MRTFGRSTTAARPLTDRPPPGTVPLALVMFAVITVLRFAVTNAAEGIGFLYVVPISVLAGELGWRAGVAAGALASALTGAWVAIQDVSLGVIGLPVRVATFVSVGVLAGLQVKRRRALERQREELISKLGAVATQDQLTGLPNRRAWDERLVQELRRARRSGEPLSVVAIDLDRL